MTPQERERVLRISGLSRADFDLLMQAGDGDFQRLLEEVRERKEERHGLFALGRIDETLH